MSPEEIAARLKPALMKEDTLAQTAVALHAVSVALQQLEEAFDADIQNAAGGSLRSEPLKLTFHRACYLNEEVARVLAEIILTEAPVGTRTFIVNGTSA